MTENDFEKIAFSLRPRLLSLARGFLSCKETAEDVTQETLLRLWIMRQQCRTEDDAAAIATAVAKNLCIDIWRKKKEMRFADLETIADKVCAAAPDEGVTDENLQRLHRAMQLLSQRDRRMLRMRHEGGMDVKQIAAAIGIAPRSTSVALCRAKERLWKILQTDGYE